MNPTLKNVLVKIAKQAVNAAFTVTLPTVVWHYHFTNWQDLKHILLLVGSAVLSRELTLVVIPWLAKAYAWVLKWSQTAEAQ